MAKMIVPFYDMSEHLRTPEEAAAQKNCKHLIKNGIFILTILMVISVLPGCPMIDWKELNFTRSKPALADIIGKWQPTAKTIRFIREEGKYPATQSELDIKPDGTFIMKDMPDWWSDGFGKSNKKFISGSGVWRLQEEDEDLWKIWDIVLQFPDMTYSIHLYGQRPPFLIFIRVGDPNNGKAMLFEKIQSS